MLLHPCSVVHSFSFLSISLSSLVSPAIGVLVFRTGAEDLFFTLLSLTTLLAQKDDGRYAYNVKENKLFKSGMHSTKGVPPENTNINLKIKQPCHKAKFSKVLCSQSEE